MSCECSMGCICDEKQEDVDRLRAEVERLTKLEADAKLGRMVRKLADDRRDLFLKNSDEGWHVLELTACNTGWRDGREWDADTPEGALVKAGVKG